MLFPFSWVLCITFFGRPVLIVLVELYLTLILECICPSFSINVVSTFIYNPFHLNYVFNPSFCDNLKCPPNYLKNG
jgi:hypothetical protein